MRNLHLIFNKLAYSRLGYPDFVPSLVDCNWLLTEAVFDHDRDFVPPVPGARTFTLRVEYPGLLVGAAGSRGVGRTVMNELMDPHIRRQRHAQDFTAMATLDYTTGQPYVPGSTVKGTLRQYFRRYPLVVAELLGCVPEAVRDLERALFTGDDVFFDAVLFDSAPDGCVLSREYTVNRRRAPRTHQGFTAAKVSPGVRLQFRFMLGDEGLPADKKLWLYRQLLLIGGIGSRTRAGYGALSETDETYDKKISLQDQSQRVLCPACAAVNYRYSKTGEKRTTCHRCKAPLPREEEPDDAAV